MHPYPQQGKLDGKSGHAPYRLEGVDRKKATLCGAGMATTKTKGDNADPIRGWPAVKREDENDKELGGKKGGQTLREYLIHEEYQ